MQHLIELKPLPVLPPLRIIIQNWCSPSFVTEDMKRDVRWSNVASDATAAVILVRISPTALIVTIYSINGVK